jgi:hypothetical protein
VHHAAPAGWASSVLAVEWRYAAYVVAAWLAGIVADLLSYPGYYDIALRDAALMVAALALGRLAWKYAPPRIKALLHR